MRPPTVLALVLGATPLEGLENGFFPQKCWERGRLAGTLWVLNCFAECFRQSLCLTWREVGGRTPSVLLG